MYFDEAVQLHILKYLIKVSNHLIAVAGQCYRLFFFPIHPWKSLLSSKQGFPFPLVLYIKLCDQLWSISISCSMFLLAVEFQTVLK